MQIAGKFGRGVIAAMSVAALALVVTLVVSAGQGMAAGELSQARSADSGSGVFAMSGMIAPKTYGLYLVDSENKTICVYQYSPKDRKLKLMAARTYRFDAQLDSFNSDDPSPAEVRQLVRNQKRLTLTGSGK